MVARAMQLVVSLQGTYGEIYWAIDSETGVQEDALVTGMQLHLSIVLDAPLQWPIPSTRPAPCSNKRDKTLRNRADPSP